MVYNYKLLQYLIQVLKAMIFKIHYKLISFRFYIQLKYYFVESSTYINCAQETYLNMVKEHFHYIFLVFFNICSIIQHNTIKMFIITN